jgi:hypothetical protein
VRPRRFLPGNLAIPLPTGTKLEAERETTEAEAEAEPMIGLEPAAETKPVARQPAPRRTGVRKAEQAATRRTKAKIYHWLAKRELRATSSLGYFFFGFFALTSASHGVWRPLPSSIMHFLLL